MPNAPRTFRSKPTTPRPAWHRSGPDLRKGLRGRKLQATKKRILERDDYHCQQCGRLVEYQDSILDHRVPLSRGGTHDESNLQTLCMDCDRIKTRREGGRNANPIRRHGVLHVICGPPGSGKTTYVQQNKSKGDIVFDFDLIAQAIGAEIYNHGQHFIEPIESIRQILINNATQTEWATWVIVTDLKRAIDTANRYNGELKIMDTSPEACIRRLRGDSRPRIDGRIDRVRSWWSELERLRASGEVV